MASLRLGPEAGCFPTLPPPPGCFLLGVLWPGRGNVFKFLGKERFIRFRGVALCLAHDDCLVSS